MTSVKRVQNKPKAKSSITGGTTEKIGKRGITKGEVSSEGGQHPHMPSKGSYSGRKGGGEVKAGKTPNDSHSGRLSPSNQSVGYPFLPAAKKSGR